MSSSPARKSGNGATTTKEIALDLSGNGQETVGGLGKALSASYLSDAAKLGVTSVIVSPETFSPTGRDGSTAIPANLKVYALLHDFRERTSDSLVETIANENNSGGKLKALRLKISSAKDISTATKAAVMGFDAIIAETGDWKVIPLENLVAEVHAKNAKIFATMSNANEVETLFGVLEVGVDGVVITPKQVGDVARVKEALSFVASVNVSFVEVTEIQEVGNGERVCVDTTSMLKEGESLLVGSKSNFLFAVHNEGMGSVFSAPRPFRVNAGAVHSYVLLPDGRTNYLSEVESGTRVLVVNKEGKTRIATVGRSKIERRPLVLVKAKVTLDGDGGKVEGTVIVQNAETIRFVGQDGRLISVTELKKGDKVLAYPTQESVGRHFGTKVDEYIVEK
jgi:3-dehydroquinate synthase II